MNKNQLKILLEHGDLCNEESLKIHRAKMNDAMHLYKGSSKAYFDFRRNYNAKNPFPSGSSVKVNGIVYWTSIDIDSALNHIFEKQIDFFLHGNTWTENGEIDKFKKQTNYELNRYSPVKEDKIEWIRNRLKQLNNDLQDLIGSITVEDYKNNSIRNFKEDGIELIICLKFDIYEGKKTSSYYYDLFKQNPNFEKIKSLLSTERINEMFTAILTDKKIEYLHELFNDLENVTEKIIAKETTSDNNNFENKNSQENIFCKGMPIEFAVNHFETFTITESNNGKPFLSREQLNTFIKRAFLGDTSIEKVNLNYTRREKLFIVKRFFQFYLMATDPRTGYENSVQCKPKYMKLLTDNFNKWDYETNKNNFRDNVSKRDWE